MAKPKTASWSKLLISVGDGGSPEIYTRQCGLTSKGISFTSDVADVAVPDCDDPDAPAWAERTVSTKSATFSGDGVLATDHRADWDDWFQTGESRSCRVEIDIPIADGGGYYQGDFILATFTINGDQDDAKLTVEVEAQSDGPVTWTEEGATGITSLSPNTGPAAGGTAFTLTGTDLTGATGVTLGGVATTAFTLVNATTITATSGAHAAGVVDVVVLHPAGNATKVGGFTYT